MPYSSGTFSLYSTGNPVVTGTTISSTWANNTLSDIATGLSTAVLKDGSQTLTANLPMSGFKLTGLGAASAAGNSVRYEQVFTTTTLTDQATVSWDASLAPVATWTMAGSRTLAAPSNLKAGGLYGLIITQDVTGGRTVTWNAVFKAQGGGTMPQPETTASAISQFSFYSPDGTNLQCLQCMPFIDTNYIVRGSADATKKVRLEVDGLTTATTRVLTIQDSDQTLVGRTTTDTLTNKSIAAATNTVEGVLVAGSTATMDPLSASAAATAHGLGQTPELVQWYLQNTSGELGYSVGDQVPGFSQNGAVSVAIDGTNVTLLCSAAPNIQNKGTGATATVTLTKWKLIAIPFKIV